MHTSQALDRASTKMTQNTFQDFQLFDFQTMDLIREPLHSSALSVQRLYKQSCDNCRRRKTKCNRVRPCNNCERLSLSCSYYDIMQRKGRKPRTTDSPKYLLQHLSVPRDFAHQGTEAQSAILGEYLCYLSEYLSSEA